MGSATRHPWITLRFIQATLLRKQGLYLEINRWETFLDAMSSRRLQDEYNQAIRDCDLFVSLFKTKTGKYTAEEFDVAWQSFQTTGKPRIYTYFQTTTVSTSASNRDDLISLWDFQKRLGELGHFYTEPSPRRRCAVAQQTA